MNVYVYLYLYLYLYLSISLSLSLSLYIQINIYTYIYIYTHIRTSTASPGTWPGTASTDLGRGDDTVGCPHRDGKHNATIYLSEKGMTRLEALIELKFLDLILSGLSSC